MAVEPLSINKRSKGTHTWLPRAFSSYSFHDLIALQDQAIIESNINESHWLCVSKLNIPIDGQRVQAIPLSEPQISNVKIDKSLGVIQQTKEKVTSFFSDLVHGATSDKVEDEKNDLEPKKIKYNIKKSSTFFQKTKEKLASFLWRKKTDINTLLQKQNEHVDALLQEQAQRVDTLLQEQTEFVDALLKKNEDSIEQIKNDHVSLNDHVSVMTLNPICEQTCEPTSVIHDFNIALFTQYQQNFGDQCSNNCHSLGAMPFWSGTNTMTFGNNDGRADLDAYQFGLGNIETDANGIGGIIQLNPKVQQVGTDLLLYYSRRHNNHGMFFKIHVPLGALIIYPNFKEIPTAIPDNQVGFTQRTQDPNSSLITYDFTDYPTPYERPQSMAEAFFGGDPATDRLRGNRPHPIRIRRGRIPSVKRVEIRLGDLATSIGYNHYTNKGFFAFGCKASFPTGNVPTADFLLDPIFGRGGAWGLGGEAAGSFLVWKNDDKNRSLTVGYQGEILHLFSGRTPNLRSFDLKQNGPGSKYLLIQNYRSHYERRNNVTSAALFTFGLQPAVNITTLPVISNIAVEGSIAFMVDYFQNNWNVSVGAEFWGRSKEKLEIDVRSAVDMRLPNLNDYAVVGRQVSAYLIDGQPISTNPLTSGLLNTFYCEPLATIRKSKDAVRLVGTVPNVTVPLTVPEGIKDARLSENRIPEKFEDALDFCGAAATSALSGKLFSQFRYIWTERCYSPSLGITAGLENIHYSNSYVKFWSLGLQGTLNF